MLKSAVGKTGQKCYQKDECISSPCEDGLVCQNIDVSSDEYSSEGRGLFECVCPDGDVTCSKTTAPLPAMHIVYIAGKLFYKVIYKNEESYSSPAI